MIGTTIVELLHECPGDLVRCNRTGQYRRAGLIVWFGADMGLPDLRAILVTEAGCGWKGSRTGPAHCRDLMQVGRGMAGQ